MSEDGWVDRAKQLYESAVFGGDVDALAAADRELDEVEADLALARGRIVHTRFLFERQQDPHELALFERAVELYGRLGDQRGEAEALFWVGIFHQVVHDDSAAALPYLERSFELAVEIDDKLTQSYAVRHLGSLTSPPGTSRRRVSDSRNLCGCGVRSGSRPVWLQASSPWPSSRARKAMRSGLRHSSTKLMQSPRRAALAECSAGLTRYEPSSPRRDPGGPRDETVDGDG